MWLKHQWVFTLKWLYQFCFLLMIFFILTCQVLCLFELQDMIMHVSPLLLLHLFLVVAMYDMASLLQCSFVFLPLASFWSKSFSAAAFVYLLTLKFITALAVHGKISWAKCSESPQNCMSDRARLSTSVCAVWGELHYNEWQHHQQLNKKPYNWPMYIMVLQ